LEEAVIERTNEDILQNFELKTHENILNNLAYEIKALGEDSSSIFINTQKYQKDENGYIFSAELITGAILCSTISINQGDFTLIQSNIDLFEPIKEDGEILFNAKIETNGTIKKVVSCQGTINGIEFLRGNFIFIKMKS